MVGRHWVCVVSLSEHGENDDRNVNHRKVMKMIEELRARRRNGLWTINKNNRDD